MSEYDELVSILLTFKVPCGEGKTLCHIVRFLKRDECHNFWYYHLFVRSKDISFTVYSIC